MKKIVLLGFALSCGLGSAAFAFDPNASYNWYNLQKIKGVRVESKTFYSFTANGGSYGDTKGEIINKDYMALCPSVEKTGGQVAHSLLLKAFYEPSFKLTISIGMENDRWGSGTKKQECISVVQTVSE